MAINPTLEEIAGNPKPAGHDESLNPQYAALGLPVPTFNGCAHKFKGWARTGFKDVYSETCEHCGQVQLFEKDFS